MAITVTLGTAVNGTANLTPTIPAGAVSGDIMLCLYGTKPYNDAPTINLDWADFGSAATDGTVAAGIDVGSMQARFFWKRHTGTESNPTVTNGTNNVSFAQILVIKPTSGKLLTDPTGAGGGDATAGTGFSITAASNFGITTDDLVVAFAAIRSDAGGFSSAAAIAAASCTFGTLTATGPGTTTSGGDMAWFGHYGLCTSGTSSAAPTYSATLAAAHTGSGYLIRVREVNAYSLTAQHGTYAVTGQSATVSRNRTLTASSGSYSQAGQSAVITHTPLVTGYTLTAQHGTYSFTGQSATLTKGRVLAAQAGSYAQTGQSAILKRSRLLTAQAGEYALNGASATLTYSGGAPEASESPRRHAGNRKGYIIKGQKYWLTDKEFQVLLAQMVQEVKRRDIQEVKDGKPTTVSRRTWLKLKQTLAALEALSEPDTSKPIASEPESEDDDEEALLMLL